jgi:hypothetical protein
VVCVNICAVQNQGPHSQRHWYALKIALFLLTNSTENHVGQVFVNCLPPLAPTKLIYHRLFLSMISEFMIGRRHSLIKPGCRFLYVYLTRIYELEQILRCLYNVNSQKQNDIKKREGNKHEATEKQNKNYLNRSRVLTLLLLAATVEFAGASYSSTKFEGTTPRC